LHLLLCIFRKDQKLFPLIKKNLLAHRPRNEKTAVMFTLCIAFLIFSGTGIQMIRNSNLDVVKAYTGTDILIGKKLALFAFI